MSGSDKRSTEVGWADQIVRDPHERRADALEKTDLSRSVAEGVRTCREGRTCKRRPCPRCSAIEARAHALTVTNVVPRMRNANATLLNWRTTGLRHVRREVEQMVDAFRTFRSRRAVRTARAAVGTLEIDLTDDRQAFNVHSHLVVDVADLHRFVAAAQREWRSISRGRGRFTIQKGRTNIISSSAIGDYITKRSGWRSENGGPPTVGDCSRILTRLR